MPTAAAENIVTPLPAGPAARPMRLLGQSVLPPERLPAAEWAQRRMRFDTTIDASPRYVIEKAPYAKTVFDWFLDRSVEEIYLIWAAQTGKSALMIALLAYIAENDPGPTLFAQADQILAQKFIKDRVIPTMRMTFPGMIRDSVRDAEFTRDGGLLGRLHLIVSWASTTVRSKSWSRRYVFGDETAEWRVSRELFAERTKPFPLNRKMVWGTTPTTEHEQSWIAATQVFNLHRWQCPCHHCGALQSLEFKNLKFRDCKTNGIWNLDMVERETYYECSHCLRPILETQRNQMLQHGESRPEFEDKSRKKMSLRISALDVPSLSWGLTARKWLEAQGDQEALKNFVTSWLAEPWVDKRSGLKARAVMSRTMDLESGTCPRNTVVLGAGIDVQRGHVYCTIRAWMDDGRSMLVWCGHFDGRPPKGDKPLSEDQQVSSTAVALQRLYDEVLSKDFAWDGHGGNSATNPPEPAQRLKIRFAAVDSGDGRTQKVVFDFARKHFGRVFPVKGMESKSGKRWTVSPAETDASGKPLGSLKVYGVNTAHYRDSIVESFNMSMAEAGAWLVCRGAPEEYGKHFEAWQIAETEIKDKRGLVKSRKREWRQIHKDDHFLDCEIYAQAFQENMPGLGMVIAGKSSGVKYGVVGNAWGNSGG